MDNRESLWVGQIPKKWQLLKLGSLFATRNEKVSDKDFPPLSVSRGGVVPQMEGVAKTDANNDRKLVRSGDFAINSRSDRKQSCGLARMDGSVSLINTILYLKKSDIIYPEYLDFLLKNYGFAEEFYRWGHGIVADLWTTRWQEMKAIMLPIPPYEMQKSICEYLTEKSTEIDSLIAVEEEQIGLLRDYKISLSREFLFHNGQPFFAGDKKRCRIKDAFDILDEFRKPIAADLRTQSGAVLYDYFGASGPIDKIDGYTVDDDVLLIGEDGANLRLRNLPLIYEVHGKAWINNHAHILKPKPIMDYEYCLLALEALDIEPFLTGSAQPKLSQENLKNMPFLFPTLEDQKRIVKLLLSKFEFINKLVTVKTQKKAALFEYKKSLIFECVTGKREVAQ